MGDVVLRRKLVLRPLRFSPSTHVHMWGKTEKLTVPDGFLISNL